MEEIKEKPGKQGYAYGRWKLGKKTDAGKYLKKPGRKTGTRFLTPGEINIEVGQIVNWMTFGKKNINNPRATKAGAKPNIPMTIIQASLEFGITSKTFYVHLKQFPEAKEKYKELKESRREYIKELAEQNIEEGISGKLGLTGKEMVDASFKMLEKTDKAYQPKIEVEQKSIGINLNKSTSDIMSELQSILGVNNELGTQVKDIED